MINTIFVAIEFHKCEIDFNTYNQVSKKYKYNNSWYHVLRCFILMHILYSSVKVLTIHKFFILFFSQNTFMVFSNYDNL